MQGVKILKDLEIRFKKVSELKEIWEEIFKVTKNPSPFVSYGWFLALGKFLLREDVDIMVFYDEEKAVGIVPANIKNGSLCLINDDRVTDFSGEILVPDYSKRIMERLANFIIKEDLNIDLYPLIEESEMVRFLPDMLKVKTLEKIEPFPVLRLPSSWSEYLAGLSAKKRHELRRKLNKIGGADIKELKASKIEKLFELMEYSKSKKEFLNGDIKDFFKALASYLEGIGALRLKGVYLKEKILGVIFAFQKDNMIYAFNTGYNPKFYKLSPGFVSFAMDIRSAIDEGFTYYNFLRGEERFKFDLGSEKVYTWKIKR
jgi:hypothetical protein